MSKNRPKNDAPNRRIEDSGAAETLRFGPASAIRHSPDAGELRAQDNPAMEFPGTGKPDFRVYFTPEVHSQIARHAQEDTSVEVGGVLVGQWHGDASGPFVAISEFVRCDEAASRSGEVTFTHEAWNSIHREMDTRFAHLRIVGWYHTHPTFGIFLSERDAFIQEHFFSNPGQVAYVVDPVAKTEGVFAWRNGKPALMPHYWVGEQIYVGAEQAAEREPAGARWMGTAPPPASQPVADSMPLLTVVRQGLVYLAVFLVGYALAAVRSTWEHRMLIEGTVAHYGIWKGLRPGLGEYLDAAAANLDKISAATQSLAKEHVQLAGEEGAEKKAQWDEIRDDLRKTSEHLVQVRERYALSPDESRAVAQVIAAKQAELQALTNAGAADRRPAQKPAADQSGQQEPKTPSESK